MKFELHFVQTFSNKKMAYTRIVDLEDLNKLGIQNFSIGDNLGFQKLVCRRQNLKNHKFEPSKLSQMES